MKYETHETQPEAKDPYQNVLQNVDQLLSKRDVMSLNHKEEEDIAENSNNKEELKSRRNLFYSIRERRHLKNFSQYNAPQNSLSH